MRARVQAGFTAIELLVSVLLISLILAGLYTVLFQTQVAFEAQQDAMALRQEARVALDRIAGQLRMTGYDIGNLTNAVMAADGRRLVVVADVDDGSSDLPCGAGAEGASGGGAERLTYRLSNGAVLQSIDCWNGRNWSNEYRNQPLLQNVVNEGPVFRYFRASGAELTPGRSGLTAAQRAQVRLITIELSLADSSPREPQRRQPSFQIRTRVQLRNID